MTSNHASQPVIPKREVLLEPTRVVRRQPQKESSANQPELQQVRSLGQLKVLPLVIERKVPMREELDELHDFMKVSEVEMSQKRPAPRSPRERTDNDHPNYA